MTSQPGLLFCLKVVSHLRLHPNWLIDLCIFCFIFVFQCFSVGAEVGNHKRDHGYQITVSSKNVAGVSPNLSHDLNIDNSLTGRDSSVSSVSPL